MKKSTILVIVLVLVASTSSFAGFAIGANAGIGMSKYAGFDPAEPKDNGTGLSFQIGLEAQYSLIPILGLKFSANYINYSGTIKYTTDETDTTHSFFDLGLALDITIVKFSIYAGGFLAFKLSATSDDTDIKDTNSPVGGILAGLAYNLGLGPIKLPIGVEFKYILGNLIDATQTYKAWALHFKVGILFGL